MPVNPPLTRNDKAEINKSLALLNEMLYELDKAKAALVPGLEELYARREELVNQLTAMRNAYFPETYAGKPQ